MSYTITDVKTDLSGIIHGTTLNQIQGVDALIYRAARKLLNDVDPIETVRIVELTNALYDKAFDYQVPEDLKGNRIIDIRPQVNRTVADRFFQIYNADFDLMKGTLLTPKGNFTIQYNTGVKSVRIDKNLLPGTLVNNCDSLTENGTWTAGAQVTDITVDKVNYVQGGGSIRFNITAGGATATISNTNTTTYNLSDDEDQGAWFMYMYLPTGADFTSINFRFGTDNANYWSQTVTSTQSSTAFQNGWNLLRFDWQGATVVGTPNAAAIGYLEWNLAYDGTAQVAVRIDAVSEKLGSIFEIEYYSRFLFRDAITGAFQETVTDDSNIVNLETDSYNLLMDLVAYFAVQQQQGANSAADMSFFLAEYDRELRNYKNKTKSQVIQPQDTYYQMPYRRVPFRRYPY